MYTTDAIILKKEGSGEADVLVSALTRDFAKVRLVAQGARKVNAKLKGHLEPLALARLSFVVGRNNYRLVSAELKDFFQTVRNDPYRFALASRAARALDGALFEDRSGANGDFFDAAKEFFSVLADPVLEEKDAAKTFLWFQTRFLANLGLFPESLSRENSSEKNCPNIFLFSCQDFILRADPEEMERAKVLVADIFAVHLPLIREMNTGFL